MQNVLIVGAGTGGSIILDLLQNLDFMNVKAIIDIDEDAPGIIRSKRTGYRHMEFHGKVNLPMIYILFSM